MSQDVMWRHRILTTGVRDDAGAILALMVRSFSGGAADGSVVP